MTYLKRSITVLSIILLLVFSALTIADTNKPDLDKNSSMYSAMVSDSLPAGDWDIDDNGQADALTDGLMFLRYAFGLSGDSLVNGLISSDSVHTTSAEIESELAIVFSESGDIDRNGSVDALTDGLLLLRYLFGLSGDSLTAGVVGAGATLSESSDLEAYMAGLMPQAPYIRLNGSATLNHEQATTYVDAGATATDVTDGSVTVITTGSVDSDTAGTYILSYSATDSDGNVSRTLTRSVTVADTTAPSITLLGEPAVEIGLDSSYEDAGATATDAVDGSVEVVTTGSVDTGAAATYILTYTATDTAGNSSTATREVTVLSPKAALSIATLTGNWSLTREAGALALGPTADDLTWWSNSEIDVWLRACLFDDVYIFGADGTFSQTLGSDTWLEPFQGVDSEGCGAPVSPHDGNFENGSYQVGDSSITISGIGAHIGLAKVVNSGELESSGDAPGSITYTASHLADDGNSITLQVAHTDRVWQFKLSKGDPVASEYGTGLDKVLNIGEVVDFNSVGTEYGLIDFGGTSSSVVADPTDSSNTVISVVKGTSAEPSEAWAGTTLLTGKVFYPLTATNTGFTVKVWSPEVGTQVKLKLEESGENPASVETDAVTTVAKAWETLTFDFNNHSPGTDALDLSKVFDTLIIYFNYDVSGSGETYYFDDVRFIGSVPVDVTSADLIGNWKLAPVEGAMKSVPTEGNTFISSSGDVTKFSCLFDDLYVFNADGSFVQELGSQTWVEQWQGVDVAADGCALPIAPHNSVNDATYSLVGTDLTISGVGNHIGLAKVTNQGELDADEPPSVPSTIRYSITSLSGNGQNMTIQVDHGAGIWHYKLIKTDDTASTEIIDVTADYDGGYIYIIDGVSKPDLTLEVGTTYIFNYPGNHPLKFSTVSDGIHNGGAEYTQGVDKSGTNQITIRVTSSTVKSLFYYCQLHAQQGGAITVIETATGSAVRIEAESFVSKIQNDDNKPEAEGTNDEGGGQNLGWFDAGDWVEYDLPITVAGNYRIDYRVASQGGSSPGINIKINSTWVDAVEIPNTGGWQNWQTVEGRVVTLEAGNLTLRVEAVSGGTNINWFSFNPTEDAASAPPEEVVNEDPILVGDWMLSPEAGALGVGPSAGNIGWWSNSADDIETRNCLFDDIFRFGSDGSFANVMGDQTWIETWQQGATSEGCATPISPHDGSNNATFEFNSGAGTITIDGLGAHLGIPKVVNAGELSANPAPSVPASITYEVVTSSPTSMTIQIGYGSGYWTFKLVKVADTARAVSKSLSHDGLNRSYITYVPNTYDGTEKFPVLMNFHGFSGDAGYHLTETNMHYAAHSNKYLLVYPQGALLEGEPHWNPCLPSADNKSDIDDLGFVEALLDQVSSDYLIDRNKVYAVGYSNGGMMSYGLAMHKSELITAFGSVSGTMLDCGEQPNHPMPVIVMHGTNDFTIPYDGSSDTVSIETTIEYWNSFNNTNTTPVLTSASDVGEKGSSVEIERYQYSDGDNGSSVELYKIVGGGHDWFDLRFDGQRTGQILLNFFSQYDLNTLL
jgi:polyhydroxybutyrate depolymerase